MLYGCFFGPFQKSESVAPFLSYSPSRNKPVPVKRGHYSVISSGNTLLASPVEKTSYIINHISVIFSFSPKVKDEYTALAIHFEIPFCTYGLVCDK